MASQDDAEAEVGARTSVHADTVAVDRELKHEDIALLAYALWEARGCQVGNPEDDWLRAEQQLREHEPAGRRR